MRVAVLGLGYVGCVTAACLADAGNTIIGVDPAKEKIDAINRGEAPIVEPGLGELISNARAAGRISAISDIADLDEVDIDIAIVCVGTPSAVSGELDLKYVRTVAEELGGLVRRRSTPLTIILRSTVLPGTTSQSFIPWIEDSSDRKEGVDFFVAFCPEFLRESTAVADFHNPPLTVVGVESPTAEDLAVELLAFVDSDVQVVASGTAEALKYSSNAFHAVKVAFANEIARVCHDSNVDARDVMNLFVQDRELNISSRYLRPGFAYGGSCLPKDVAALQAHARARCISVPMIDSLTVSNDAHIDRVVRKVEESGARTVAIVGLTFKPNTDDLRESPYVKVAAHLRALGVVVSAYDPIIKVDKLIGANRGFIEATLPDLESILVETLPACLDGADLVLLGTNSADVCDELLSGPQIPVVDLSGMLPSRVENALRDREVGTTKIEAYVGAAW
jgi:GDP-mannose 6-dehydrogenase